MCFGEEKLVAERSERRDASPSSLRNTEEVVNSSGGADNDFHTINIAHESEVEVQNPTVPHLQPSASTTIRMLDVFIPVAAALSYSCPDSDHDHEEPQKIMTTSADHHRLEILLCWGQNGGDKSQVAKTPANYKLGKMIVSLTFQAGVGLIAPILQNSFTAEELSHSHTPGPGKRIPLHLVQLAMVIGFGVSFMGIWMRFSYPVTAGIMERTGSFFAAMGFFLMMSLLLPHNLMWIAWMASAASLAAFPLPCLKSQRLGFRTAS